MDKIKSWGVCGRPDLLAEFAHTTCKMSALARGARPFGLLPLGSGLVSRLGHCHAILTVVRLRRVCGGGFSPVFWEVSHLDRLIILYVLIVVGESLSNASGGVAVIIWILGGHEDPQLRS